jgi:hypothetical protein
MVRINWRKHLDFDTKESLSNSIIGDGGELFDLTGGASTDGGAGGGVANNGKK